MLVESTRSVLVNVICNAWVFGGTVTLVRARIAADSSSVSTSDVTRSRTSCEVTATASVCSISRVSELESGVYGLPTSGVNSKVTDDEYFGGREYAKPV